MTTSTRNFESFAWITFRKLMIMLGFGWSRDWASAKPWSVSGETVPYISTRVIGQNKNTSVRGFFLGPAAMIYAKTKNND